MTAPPSNSKQQQSKKLGGLSLYHEEHNIASTTYLAGVKQLGVGKMALRPIGVYLLTSSALYAQKKTVYHVGKMTKLAIESAAITTRAGEELASSIEMEEKAALESEEGLELQSESIGKRVIVG